MWQWIGSGTVVLAALLLGVVLLRERLFPKPVATEEVLLAVTDTPVKVASPIPTFTQFATVTAKLQNPTAPPTLKAATPSLLTGIMTTNANCWETASEGSNNAKILKAGDNVTILGKSADGNWYNLDFANNTQQNYCNTTNLVTDCWLKINDNITLLGSNERLPVFTPRPAAFVWRFRELSCTKPDGSGGFGGDYDNVNYSDLVNQLNSLVNQYQKGGTACTFRTFKACK